MEKFLENFGDKIIGVQQGFDHIMIKGYIRDFQIPKCFYAFLSKEKCLLKDYSNYVQKKTQIIKDYVKEISDTTKCHTEFLASPTTDKLEIAKSIYKRDPSREGLLCILSCVEPCYAITVRKNPNNGELEKRYEYRKCTQYYFYYNDKDFGIMFIKIQSWLPYTVKIYINGKEYLKRQLQRKGIRYNSYNNSLTWVEDIKKSQSISDKFIEKKWHKVLDVLARRVNPLIKEIERLTGRKAYTWCLDYSEYATDILFKNRQTLEEIYPKLVEYASLCQVGENIFTFFGKKLHGTNKGEAVSDRKNYYQQGFRVKFVMGKNSIKMYDKNSVLRIETTVNNSRFFKIIKQGNWLPMGKGISNMYRIAEISRKCNERYLDSLSVINSNADIDRSIESLCHTKITTLSKKTSTGKPRSYGAFNLLRDSTCKLFNAIMNGAYVIIGFTRKDIIDSLIRMNAFSKTEMSNMKKLTDKVTRLLAKLRAHGLIQKYAKTFKYRVTLKGQEVISRIILFKKMDLIVC